MRVAKKWKNIHKKKLKQPSPDRKGEPGKVVVVEVVLAAVAFALLFFFPSSFAVWPRHNRIQFFSFYGKRGKGSRDIDLPHTEEGGKRAIATNPFHRSRKRKRGLKEKKRRRRKHYAPPPRRPSSLPVAAKEKKRHGIASHGIAA